MAANNAEKERLVEIVRRWRRRSNLSVPRIVARLQSCGLPTLSESVFENRFTTHLELPVSIPPSWVVATIRCFTDGLPASQRCTAVEALEFAELAQFPFHWLNKLTEFFSEREFNEAYRVYEQPDRAPRAKPVRADTLPRYRSTFVGRTAEKDALTNLILASRVVTVAGMGGGGKSRLAAKVAEHLREDFGDGVWFVSLENAQSEASVEAAFAQSLRLAPSNAGAHASTPLDYLENKRALVVFDNCEHVAAAVRALIKRMLAHCALVHVVATSRSPLGLDDEAVYRLRGLPLPPAGDGGQVQQTPDGLLQFDAVKLFVARANELRKGLRLKGRSAASVARICRNLDGNPLAIEIAASNLRHLSLHRLAAETDKLGLSLRNHYERNRAHHRSLTALLEWNAAALDPTDRAVLGAAAAFVGGLTLKGLQDVAALPDVAPSVARLEDRSLLSPVPSSAASRWAMPALVREFVWQRLDARERHDLEQRHADWCASFVAANTANLDGPVGKAHRNALDTERANLERAAEWSFAAPERAEHAAELCAAAWPYWRYSGDQSAARERIAVALKAVKPKSSAPNAIRTAVLLHGAGALAFDMGDYVSAKVHLAAAVARFDKLGDLKHKAIALRDLGDARRLGYDTRAKVRDAYLASLDIFKATGDLVNEAVGLDRLGNVAYTQGDLEGAVQLFQRGLDLRRRAKDDSGIASSHRYLGMVLRYLGRYAEADEQCSSALQVARELGEPSMLTQVLLAAGRNHIMQGRKSEARFCLEEAHVLCDRLQDKFGVAQCLNLWGEISRYEGKTSEAAAHYLDCVRLLRDIGQASMVPWVLCNLGFVTAEMGQLAEAASFHGDALVIRRQHADTYGLWDTFEGYAAFGEIVGALDSAATLFGSAARLREKTQSVAAPVEQVEFAAIQGRLRATLGDEKYDACFARGRALTLERAAKLCADIGRRARGEHKAIRESFLYG